MEELGAGQPLFPRRALAALYLPLVVEQLLVTTVGMADTVMVATVGEKAVSSIALVDSINNLIIMLLSALTTGGAIVVSQYIGRQDPENGRLAARQLVYASTALMIVLAAVVVGFRHGILRLIYGNLDETVMRGAMTYFLLTALSFPFLAVYNSCAALFRSMGNSKVSMLASLLMNVINIVGNAILIYIFDWEVAGAATATLCSRAIAALLMLRLIRSRANVIYLENLRFVNLNFTMVRRILSVGVPSGIENSLFQIGKLFVSGLLASLGTAAIAANAILNSIWGVLIVPASAANLAMISVVGQCIGARECDQAKRYTQLFIGFSMLALAVTGLPTLLFSRQLIGMFNLSKTAVDIAVPLYALMIGTNVLFWPLSFGLPHALRATGDVRYPMIVSMLSMWIFRVGLCYVFLLVFHMGLPGIWYAMFTDWIVRIICFVPRFASGKWRTKCLID